MSGRRMEGLTAKQERVARVVADFERRGIPVFVPELVAALGLAAESSLTPTLRIMERNGFLEIFGGGRRRRSRLVRLGARGRHAIGLGGLPLLGSIPAGPLDEAVAGAEEVIGERELLPYREGDFLLRVRGDSMTGDGILDGDKVLLRPGVEVQNGEIAAVLIGDAHEATLKRVFFVPERHEIVLRAGNPAYPDRAVPAAEVKIAGVFRGLVRDGSRAS